MAKEKNNTIPRITEAQYELLDMKKNKGKYYLEKDGKYIFINGKKETTYETLEELEKGVK